MLFQFKFTMQPIVKLGVGLYFLALIIYSSADKSGKHANQLNEAEIRAITKVSYYCNPDNLD